MAKGSEVLSMLCPDSEWAITNDDYDSILWVSGKRITKQEFEAGFAKVDAWKSQKELEAAVKRQALLDKLGITEEEAKLLLS